MTPIPPTERERPREYPLLFSAPMVRALLAGMKSQTRRLDKRWMKVKAGDRLWVRETWAAHWMYNDVPPSQCKSGLSGDNYWFAADGDDAPSQLGSPPRGLRGKTRVSIHMPRWASRLTLTATADAREERLQDISEADARAEGCEPDLWVDTDGRTRSSYRQGYRKPWDAINPKAPWASNPEVVVLTFERTEGRAGDGEGEG